MKKWFKHFIRLATSGLVNKIGKEFLKNFERFLSRLIPATQPGPIGPMNTKDYVKLSVFGFEFGATYIVVFRINVTKYCCTQII